MLLHTVVQYALNSELLPKSWNCDLSSVTVGLTPLSAVMMISVGFSAAITLMTSPPEVA